MVHFLRLISAAALVSVSSAAPMVRRGDSAIGAEIPVSAPNGIPMSDPTTYDATSSAAETASTPSAWASSSTAWTGSSVTSSSAESYQTASSYGGSSYGGSSGGYGGSSYQPPSGGSYQASSGGSYQASSSGSYQAPSYTQTSSAAWSQITYGSGSSSYGGSSYGGGYNDCVQQCAASYSMPAATWAPPTATASDSLNIGGPVGTNGVTHTIIVAPTQGVLRFVPFSTNASVGDTLEFHWGANTHTVTQSSALEVCNKTDSAGAFASGTHDKGTVYTQTVNDTKPIWFYCGTPGHCEKGMFGGVNIGANSEGTTSYTPLSQYVSNITASNPDVMATWMYAKNKTSSNAFASGWGMSTDCSNMNDDQRASTLQNVLYNQITISMNPQNVQGNVFKANNALAFPMDLPALLANANASAPSNTSTLSSSATVSSSSAAASGTGSTAGTTSKNGAGALASSSVVVGFAAIVATFFLV